MYKQKLIDHLYQYTSKELEFGCEVELKDSGIKGQVVKIKKDATGATFCLANDIHYLLRKDEVNIIGHPPQWHHLLLALGDAETISKMYLSHNGQILFIHTSAGTLEFDLTTNLQDIPEKDARKLVELLNIE